MICQFVGQGGVFCAHKATHYVKWRKTGEKLGRICKGHIYHFEPDPDLQIVKIKSRKTL